MNEIPVRTVPLYIKAVFLLLLAILTIHGLVYAKFVLVPVVLGSLFSIMLTPVATRLEKLGIHRAFSSLLGVVVLLAIVWVLALMLYKQVMSFAANLPAITDHVQRRLNEIQNYIERQTNLSPTSQVSWLKKQVSLSGAVASDALSTTTSVIATCALIPLYTFFLLFYRDRIFVFFEKITSRQLHETVHEIIHRIQELVQSYLSGIITVVFIVTVIVTTGLKIIGVPYALFLGVLAGVLNVIPYLGIFTAAALSITISTIMMDTAAAPLAVFLLFLGTHLLEANIITPNIVGSKVSINTLASLLALVIGEEVWGIVGMILFIPIFGIMKVIFDNLPHLEPYGYLMGKTTEGQHTMSWKGTWAKMKRMFAKRKD